MFHLPTAALTVSLQTKPFTCLRVSLAAINMADTKRNACGHHLVCQVPRVSKNAFLFSSSSVLSKSTILVHLRFLVCIWFELSCSFSRASIVIRGTSLVCDVPSIVLLSNRTPCLERYRVCLSLVLSVASFGSVTVAFLHNGLC